MTSTGATSDMRVGRVSSFFSLRMIAAGLVVALLAGCNEKKVEKVAAEPAIPFQGTKIVVAAPAGYQFAANWKSILDEWTEQTGATAEVLEYPNGAPVIELTSVPAAENKFAGMDLIIFPPNQFGEL